MNSIPPFSENRGDIKYIRFEILQIMSPSEDVKFSNVRGLYLRKYGTYFLWNLFELYVFWIWVNLFWFDCPLWLWHVILVIFVLFFRSPNWYCSTDFNRIPISQWPKICIKYRKRWKTYVRLLLSEQMGLIWAVLNCSPNW